MGALTGIIAGVATIGGAVALARYVDRRRKDVLKTVEELQRRATGNADFNGAVLDYAQDPSDGVYRPKA